MFLNFETGLGLDELNTTQSVEGAKEEAKDRTPKFVVDARNSQDVVQAVLFAREHRLKLRIKNTGHDYLGRSSGSDTFTIWTHHLSSTSFNLTFVPAGAPDGTEPQSALLAGAGATVYDLNLAAYEAGVLVPAGVSKTVGAAGGFVLGGGHGPLAPLLGLAADNVLEFTLVIANGSIITASRHSNPSLFESLLGGGASSYGVILETIFKTSPIPDGFVGIFGTFAVNSDAEKEKGDESWNRLIKGWIDLQPQLSDAGPFAGYTYVRRPLPTPFAYILPSSDIALAREQFDTFFEPFKADSSLEIDYHYHETSTWFELWNGEFTEALHSLDEVGINLLLGSRLVPRQVVEQKSLELSTFLAESKSPSIVHLVAGNAVAREPEFPTSVNPAWRSTLLHIDLPIAFPSTAPSSTISSLKLYLNSITSKLGSIASSLGHPEASYSSESNYFEEETKWREVWFGKENAERLWREKEKWDCGGVFSGRRTVGQ